MTNACIPVETLQSNDGPAADSKIRCPARGIVGHSHRCQQKAGSGSGIRVQGSGSDRRPRPGLRPHYSRCLAIPLLQCSAGHWCTDWAGLLRLLPGSGASSNLSMGTLPNDPEQSDVAAPFQPMGPNDLRPWSLVPNLPPGIIPSCCVSESCLIWLKERQWYIYETFVHPQRRQGHPHTRAQSQSGS